MNPKSRRVPNLPIKDEDDFDETTLKATVAILRDRLLAQVPPPPPLSEMTNEIVAARLYDKALNRRALRAAGRAVKLSAAPPTRLEAIPTSLRAVLPMPLGLPEPVDNPRVTAQMILKK